MKRVAWMTVVFLALAAPAMAQDPEDIANDISNKVNSPFCPGVTLHDCPSPSALDMRDRIEGYARQGMDESAIMERLEAEYGQSIRAEPSSEGAGILVWILPSVAVFAGGVLAWMLVRRWTSRRPQRIVESPQATVELSASERQRLDAELGRLRRES
ncbi:MAG: cytochrome c-type biogenesis protein [Actinomycetota bacterium]